MTKYTEINGIYFETHKSKHAQNMIYCHLKHYSNKDLYNHYEKPSDLKIAIYNEWLDWYLENDSSLAFFEVTNASIFQFTIGCILLNDKNEYIGYIRITKEHNYLYLI